jgi:kinesin family member 20
LAVVGLAGSERKQRTQAQGDRLREAININQSLTTLGRCLNILKLNQFSKNPQQVPYRDSKLTRMFQDMISEGKVVMIVNASPSELDVDENSYILKYAAIASKINTGSKIDTKLDIKKTTTTTKATPFNLSSATSKTPRSSVLKTQNPSEIQIQNELTLEFKVRQNVSKDMEKSLKELEETFLLNLEQTVCETNI